MQSSDVVTRRQRRFVVGVGLCLALLLAGIVASGARIWIAYNETFGARTVHQEWLHRKISSYSVDVYEELLAVKRLQIYCLRFAEAQMEPERFNVLRRQVVGTLTAFEPGGLPSEELSQHESFKPAYEAMQAFLAAAERLEKGTGDIETAFALGETAADAWGRLSVDAISHEFELRDGMEQAIVEFRPLAVQAFLLTAVLIALCVIAVSIAAYAGWRMLQAERRRFDRFELLLATVGHDLRSPLQALVGAAKLAATDGSPGSRLKFVQIVHERSSFFTRLLDDLINTARSEALSFMPVALDLTSWFDLAAPRYRQAVESKGLAFSSSLEASCPAILFDVHRLTQVVDNLISNAVRYTDSGDVGLTIRCELPSVDGSYELTVVVTDTGRGISPEDVKRIFEPFVRVDQSVKGMGVGLAMVESIAQRAGGSVSLESTPGLGSTFTFKVPVLRAPLSPSATAARPQQPPPAAGARTLQPVGSSAGAQDPSVPVPRVLVVDDDPAITEVVAGMLPHMGFGADFAVGGRAGLEMAARSCYCAVLTDIQMPDIDGFEVARSLRQTLDPCPTLIAMTAYTTKLSRDKRAAAFDASLTKPFDETVLLELLDNAATRWDELTA